MNNKKRNPILIVILAVFLGLGLMVLLNSVIKPTPVVVAKSIIAPGTVLTEDLVEVRTLPAGGVPKDAFATIDEVVGKSVAVGRTIGDPIVESVLGDNASAGIPSQLAEGHVAIAISVDKASAVAGILRAGQSVSLIGMITPDVLSQQMGISTSTVQSIITNDGTVETVPGMVKGTPTPAPVLGPVGKISITNVRVLMVPQNFQYEEVPSTANQQELFANSAATSEDKSVIVLDVPTTSIEIAPGVFVNPATLIATLNDYGKIYLALEPSTGLTVSAENNVTINLADLYNLINESTVTNK
jgi:Flp pilus assembly protein CpaB